MNYNNSEYEIKQRNWCSKLKCYKDNVEIDTEESKKMLEIYMKQSSHPERYFDIQDEILMSVAVSDEFVFLPEGIETIKSDVFRGNMAKAISLPNSLQRIEFGAFHDSKITGITIPPNVYYIGGCCFYGCEELKSLKMYNEIIEIEKYAFSHCPELKEVEFSAKLEILQDFILSDCKNLEKVTLPANLKGISSGIFYKNCALKTICHKNNEFTNIDDLLKYCKKNNINLVYGLIPSFGGMLFQM